ncbi:hypothetical protein TNCV_2734491 [Trichonephila clavipes]|nr:hypothetical protein TNCV_2734491 [Trichonephila clavipes]
MHVNSVELKCPPRWCGVVVRRGGASSGVVHVTDHGSKITWFVAKSPRVAEQCDVNIQSINQSIGCRDIDLKAVKGDASNRYGLEQ